MSKFVDFTYCNSCIFKNKEESEDPCHECLDTPAREESKIPVKYKKKDKNETRTV